MKRLLLLSSLMATLAMPVMAQTTNTFTLSTVWDFLTTGSNYWVEGAATFSPNYKSTQIKAGQFGGEFDLGVNATDWLQPVLGLTYFQSQFWAFSGSAQLSPPRSFMGNFPVTPYARVGFELPFSGLGLSNGQIDFVTGGGVYVPLKFLGSGWVWQHSKLDARWDHHTMFDGSQADNIVVGYRVDF